MHSRPRVSTVAFLPLAFALLLACTGSPSEKDDSRSQQLTYEGSSTIADNILPAAVRAFEDSTGIAFSNVGRQGSGTGFRAVMEGTADIGGMSRELKRTESVQRPYYRIIGYDALAIFVNERSLITDLSKQELKDIFTGKTTNWKKLGGPDAEIEVVTEFLQGGRATIEEFQKKVMDGLPFGETTEIDLPADCVRYVARTPNSITHAALAFQVPGVRALSVDGIQPSPNNVQTEAYQPSRPLLLISKSMPRGAAKQFFDFVTSPEGQVIVAEKFVSVL